MAPLALLTLLLAAADAMFDSGEMGRVKRILKSPVTQKMAGVLGLNLPEVPEYDVMANIENLDINELASRAGESGCLPAGTQYDDATRDAVAECVADAYNQVRPRWGRRRRSLANRIRDRIIARGKALAWTCLAERLNLVDADGQLSQAGVEAIIDGMTLPDEQLRTHKKNMTRLCIEETPEELSGDAALQFQLRCVGEMNGLDCALGMAYQVSPTVGFLVMHGAGKCLCNGAIPPPRAAMAYAMCTANGVSDLMRERLDATADATGRRRRRDVDMMAAWRKMGGLEAIERAIGAGPPQRPCRNTVWRRCPPSAAARSEQILASIDEELPQIERLAGPLDEAFASVPARANNIASCWLTEMQVVNDDGSISVDKMKEIVGQFSRPDPEVDAVMKATTADIIDYCAAQGATASVDQFSECWAGAAAYACRFLEAAKDAKREQQQQQRPSRRRFG